MIITIRIIRRGKKKGNMEEEKETKIKNVSFY